MDCPWPPQITLFLTWGSFSWVRGWWHPAHVMPRLSCPTSAMLLLEPTRGVIFQVPAPVHWLSLSFCRTEIQGNVCVWWVGGACVSACFHLKLYLKPSPYPASLPSPWASADLHAAAWGGQSLMTVLVNRMDLRGALGWAGIRGRGELLGGLHKHWLEWGGEEGGAMGCPGKKAIPAPPAQHIERRNKDHFPLIPLPWSAAVSWAGKTAVSWGRVAGEGEKDKFGIPPLLLNWWGEKQFAKEVFNATGRSFGSLECTVCTLEKKKNLYSLQKCRRV